MPLELLTYFSRDCSHTQGFKIYYIGSRYKIHKPFFEEFVRKYGTKLNFNSDYHPKRMVKLSGKLKLEFFFEKFSRK
jgi:hypothetical protein